MVILFPKNHNPHFPLLILFIRDTLLPIFIFLSYKVCLLQIHVPDVCGLAFLALPIWAVCLVSLTGSSSGSPWPPHPRPHHKRQQCVGKYQMTSPATHQLEGGQGPAGCHPRRAGEGKKKKTPVSLLALPLPYSHFICVCKVVHFIALNQGARKTPNWVLQDILIFHLSLPYLSNIPAYPFTFKNGAIRSNLFFNWNLIRETGNPNFRSSGRPGQAGEDGKQEREIGSQNKTTLQWNHPKGKNEKTSTIYILLQSTLIMCFKFFYITTPC